LDAAPLPWDGPSLLALSCQVPLILFFVQHPFPSHLYTSPPSSCLTSLRTFLWEEIHCGSEVFFFFFFFLLPPASFPLWLVFQVMSNCFLHSSLAWAGDLGISPGLPFCKVIFNGPWSLWGTVIFRLCARTFLHASNPWPSAFPPLSGALKPIFR